MSLLKESAVRGEHGQKRASTKINLTQKSPVVRWATEQAAQNHTAAGLAVYVCVWVEPWQSSQSGPCGLWWGRVSLLHLITVSLVTPWQGETEKKEPEI